MNTPKDYLCPITLELMGTPVILIEDGRSYEKHALERWLHNHDTSPITNKVLKRKDFILNINLKNAIEDFREKQAKLQLCETLSNAIEIKSGRLPSDFQHGNYPQLRIKICMLGNSGVGKTSIVQHLRFQDQISKQGYVATVGPDIITLHLESLFEDRYAVVIHIFDLPGELQWKDVWKNHYQCHGAILVCNVAESETMSAIENEWYPRLQQYGFPEFESTLLCNKIDLAEDFEDQIFKDAERFSTNNNLSLFYTSALTGKNVKSMFNQLVLCILNNRSLMTQLKENAYGTAGPDNSRQESNTQQITGGLEHVTLNKQTTRKKKNKQAKDSSCC